MKAMPRIAFAVWLACATASGEDPATNPPPKGKHADRAQAKADALGFTQEYDTPPRPKKITRPKYPPRAFQACVQGTVLLMLPIDANGKVVKPEVAESIPLLDEAALSCVGDWRFDPATKAGAPVGTVALAPVQFKIYKGCEGSEPKER
jgi:TonB family protein